MALKTCWTAPFLTFALLAVSEPPASHADGKDPIRLEFSPGGRLTSSIPERLRTGLPIEVRVNAGQQDVRAPAFRILDHYRSGIINITAELKKPQEQIFGIAKEDLASVKTALCHESCQLLEAFSAGAGVNFLGDDLDYYYATLGVYSCPVEMREVEGGEKKIRCRSGTRNPDLVPKAEDLSKLGFQVILQCFESDGRPTVPEPLALAAMASDASVFSASSETIQKQARCHKLTYQLRQDNPLSQESLEWWEKHPLPEAVPEAVKEAKTAIGKQDGPREIAERWRKDIVDWTRLLEKLKRGENVVAAAPSDDRLQKAEMDLRSAPDAARQALAGLSTKIKQAGWIKKWLWLSRGKPRIDPTRIGPTADLAAEKAKLAQLEAEVASFELLARNQNFQERLKELQERLPAIGKIRVQRDQQAKAVRRLEASIRSATEAQHKDTFLYDGLLMLRGAGVGKPVMRHHDALADYVDMSPRPEREINEGERMYVLVANESPATALSLEVTAAPITTDPSALGAELAFDPAAGDGAALAVGQPMAPTIEARDLAERLEDILKRYSELSRILTRLDEQLHLPRFPPRPAADPTPTYVTRHLPHKLEPAPTQVAYTVKTGTGPAAREVEEDQYRLNKLYRYRFRAGLFFSGLETFDFTLEDDAATGSKKVASEELNTHGVDGIFGIQTYFGPRQDLRQTNLLRFSAMLGFSMEDPLDNFLLGLGWEPVGGMTVLGGRHLGLGEELIEEDGVPIRIEDDWQDDWFYALTFDVDLFRRLFGLKSLLD